MNSWRERYEYSEQAPRLAWESKKTGLLSAYVHLSAFFFHYWTVEIFKLGTSAIVSSGGGGASVGFGFLMSGSDGKGCVFGWF